MILYGWGSNTYGQLGLGYKSDCEYEPKQIDLSKTDIKAENIVCIAGGATHTLILDSNGVVYCCGHNSKGQLGLREEQLEFANVDVLNSFRITRISCGWDYSTAISECGKIFVWGSNEYGQLGLSYNLTCTSIPSRLYVPHTFFKDVSCGLGHSAMITHDGQLLVAGDGNDGQLGLGHSFDQREYLGTSGVSKVYFMENIVSVATGQYHTVLLRKDGKVLTCGDNKHGQLGIDCASLCNVFTPIEVFHNENLEKVYAGWTHSAALSKNGEIFIWGGNNYGQLGSPRHQQYKPDKIPNLTDVVHLSLGLVHNVAVTKNGCLLTWGWNDIGSCGITEGSVIMEPTKILSNHRVKLAFACYNSAFAVVE
ncbi:secretion-regulating guanine nucleotide exchange factor-like [Aethina tumida]|uniref:secretion-regulating guanine nucleotide exchange factor-like n=1 Tax=Aethina tumida TaxID=116153 RepID=UPI00096AE545|nr:secretion-regulating guanine nucleotide exchange factor-like [Aethina tumida]